MFITPWWAFSHHHSAERKTHNYYCAMYVCVSVFVWVCVSGLKFPVYFHAPIESSSSSCDWCNEAFKESQSASTRCVKGALLDLTFRRSQELSRWGVDRLLYIRRRFLPAVVMNTLAKGSASSSSRLTDQLAPVIFLSSFIVLPR